MKTKLISFYSDTDDTTYYSDHAKRLDKNCNDLGINYEITHLESDNDYRLNTLKKPKFILEKMHEFKSPILWMDVDSYIHRRLDFFDAFESSDFDMVYATEARDWGPMKASPIYLPYREKTLKMMELWIRGCDRVIEENRTLFDHEVLLWDVLPQMIDHPLHGWKQLDPMKLFALGPQFCTWPQSFNDDTFITMGLSDVQSKGLHLENMGYETEESRKFQMVGTVEGLEGVYFNDVDVIGNIFPENFPNGHFVSIQKKDLND